MKIEQVSNIKKTCRKDHTPLKMNYYANLKNVLKSAKHLVNHYQELLCV